MVSVKHLAHGQHGDQNGCTEQYGKKCSSLGLRLRSFFSFGASAHVQTLPQGYVTALTRLPLLATAPITTPLVLHQIIARCVREQGTSLRRAERRDGGSEQRA